MKTVALFLASLAISTAAAAQAPRLALWVTDSIGMGAGEKCTLSAAEIEASGLLTSTPTLTERDVTAWNRDNGRWTLHPVRFSSEADAARLQDRCFVLAIDGRPISSGIVLSSRSARLTGLQTISVANTGNAIELQLTSGNHGRHARVIHTQALDAVLAQPANLAQQLQRLSATDDAMRMQSIGNEWTNAVQQLIDQNKIRQGMTLKELIQLLGEPSAYPRGYSGPHFWRFTTPQREFSSLYVDIQDKVVRAYQLERR